MEVYYAASSTLHNPQESFAEGPYRLRGIEQIGKLYRRVGDVLGLIRSVHSEDHLRLVSERCFSGIPLAEISTSKDTFEAALDAVGLAVFAAQNSGFAATRPPGHHAHSQRAAGFCLFNNMAVAVKHLVGQGRRVAIIDIDGHHGDGTQSIFYDDAQVLFCSLHQEEAFPYTGKVSEIGVGRGKGLTLNVPLPNHSSDDVLLRVLSFFKEYVTSFAPDIIAVSAGFDGFFEDNLLGLNYSVKGFYDAAQEVRSWGVPCFAVLEGGYHDKVLACIEAFVGGMNGDDYEGERANTVSDEGVLRGVESRLTVIRSMLSGF